MAKAKKARPGIGKSRCGLASSVLAILSNWEQNRKPLQQKWEKNSQAYRAISSGYWKTKETADWRSNAFLNITKQKVLAAYAIIVDTLLSGGKIPFIITPAPWEDVNLKELDPELLTAVESEIKMMVGLIDQQLLTCNADRELMKNILAAAIYGETWQKDTVGESEYSHYEPELPELPEGVEDMSRIPQELVSWKITKLKRTVPGTIYVSTWDMFYDMENDDIQEGQGIIHRQLVSPFWLRSKKNKRYFFNAAIESVLGNVRAEMNTGSSGTDSLPPAERDVEFRQNTIEYSEFWGRQPRDVVESFERERAEATGKKVEPQETEDYERGDDIEVLSCVANGEIVRFTRRPKRRRPFRRCVFEANLDANGGVGVADNAEDMQLMVNGGARAFFDNKNLSGNLVGGIKPEMFEEDVTEIRPGTLFHLSAECDDIKKGLMFADIPDVGESLLSVIHLAQQYADMNTMIPKVQQGIETKEKLTAFEISQLIEKAGKYLGAVIRNFDEQLIEPMILSFYQYNMNDPEVVRGKGDYLIKATGFLSFQNKVERITKMQQMLTLALTNDVVAKETNIRWYLEELHKALDIDTDKALKSEEQKIKEAEARTPSPEEELMVQSQQANIAKTNATAQLSSAKAQTTSEKMVVERALAVSDIQDKRDKIEADTLTKLQSLK